MNNNLFRAAAVAAAFALPQAAQAAVVYNEAVDGDAGILVRPSVTLGLGRNDLVGSLTLSTLNTPATDFDAFDLVVAAGHHITSILANLTLTNDGTGDFSAVAWLMSLGFDFIGQVSVPTTSTDLPLYPGVFPLGPGTYKLSGDTFFGPMAQGDYRVVDYKISINVSPTPVPLPAAGGLLAVALGALAVARRRKRA